MDSPPPPSRRPPLPPSLLLSRSKSTSKSESKPNSYNSTRSTMTVSRAASNASSQSRTHSPSFDRGTSPTNKHPNSTPPTWRAKFASANPLRRKTVNIATTSKTTAVEPKRWPTGSTTSGHSHLSQRSSFSYAGDEAEILKAHIVELVRAPTKPKIVDARSPMTTSTSQQRGGGEGTKGERKLLKYWGVRQSDREVVARQRADSRGGRVSAFREELGFEPKSGRSSVTAVGQGDGGDGKALPFPPRDESLRKGSKGLSEGLVKWFRCDIFPSDAQDFHAAESEAKRLVVDGSGKVMEQWTYPGGFMFQIPRNLASPLPPSIPSATPTPEEAVLAVHLGPNGSLRVTEFQPHLEPMEHLLHLASASAHAQRSNRISQATTSAVTTTSASEDEDTGDLVSAFEYLTQSEHEQEIEEIPLLRTTPTKSKPKPHRNSTSTSHSSTQRSQRESLSDPFALSPIAKTKLHAWLGKQQGGATTKKRRGGQVYGLPGSNSHSPRSRYALKKIEEEAEVEVVEESELLGEEEGEWVSDDGDGDEGVVGAYRDNGSDAGSEFSIATGLDSVKFVAECGSLF